MSLWTKDADPKRRFFQACFDGKRSAVEKLLEAGMAIDAIDPKAAWSALHFAVENENVPVVQFLLERGAYPNTPDASGNTPLHLAVDIAVEDQPGYESAASLALITMLLAHGADPTAQNTKGETPLAWAEKKHYRNAVEVMKRFL